MRAIFTFWLSLAFTNFFMALELPLCTALISTRADAKLNLAAYGIVIGLGLFLQAPILRIISLPLLFLTNQSSYISLRNFSFFVCVSMSFILWILSSKFVFSSTIVPLFELKNDVQYYVKRGLEIWIFYPILVGIRRFYNGLLLKFHRPSKITAATLLRLLFLVASMPFISCIENITSIEIALLSVLCGLFFEMLLSMYFARDIHGLCKISDEHDSHLSLADIIKVYAPLSLSSILAMGNAPLLSALAARGLQPLESLAVVPVVLGFLQPFTWTTFAIQDTTHALVNKDNANAKNVYRFTLYLGAGIILLLLIFHSTHIIEYYYRELLSLSPALLSLTRFPTNIIIAIPFFTCVRNFYKAILINQKRTLMLLVGEVVELVSIFMAFYLGVKLFERPAVDLVFVSLLASQVCIVLVLKSQVRS